MNFKELAKGLEEEIITWRRELHKIPEVGLELPKTLQYVTEQLEAMGLEVKKIASGLTAEIKSGDNKAKTFAIRADMDALLITEETGLSFASEHEGRMHACGHDAHTAIVLGVAKLLVENQEKLIGNVRFLFQPAEEGPGGAKPMIEAGALEGVDAIVGLHVGNIFEEIENGQIGVKSGEFMACLDRFSLEVEGRGGHGAIPETTIDPVVIASSIVQEFQTLISREISPTTPGVITVGEIHGGTAYNIIPEKVKLEGTVRFINESARQEISHRMEELSSGIAAAKQGKVNFDYHYGCPPLVNDQKFTDYFAELVRESLGSDRVVEINEPTMGGDDMAYYLQEVPGTYFYLGAAQEVDGQSYPHHNPKFDVDESVLWIGTALLAQVAVDWLEKI
ncbi:M20 family metallopeptidase [Natroniella sulfidigena]|uniref:M20 metallopeptidase family protein n=1 Tax=Natroniella sulfidigena TaxID=723921 RepID=UPI00200A1AAB|nr:M20 family metallopeptidase [Natroniella sulfidigena]MCK8817837.1 M20 family metallopeptidase [Natroniella sulfidigena]